MRCYPLREAFYEFVKVYPQSIDVLLALDTKQKNDLWKKLLENEETKNLFTFVKSINGALSYVISKENQEKLKHLFKQNGFTVKISVPKDKTNSKTPPSNDGR